MKQIRLRSLTVLALATLSACATNDGSRAWRIEPVLRVQHSAEASAAFYRTGRYYDGMERWAQAADEYRKAVTADPRNADAFNARGVALARLGDHAGAENSLRQALALAPARADVQANLGLVLVLAGRPAEAVAELSKAVALDPQDTVAHDNLRKAQERAWVPAQALATTSHSTTPPAPAPTPVPAPDVQRDTPASPGRAAMEVIDRPSMAWRDATTTLDAASERAATASHESGPEAGAALRLSLIHI